MKRLYFNSEKDFLEKLDGKVYAVSDKNGRYICDIIEDDYLKMLDLGILIDLDSNLDFCNMDVDSNAILTIDLGKKGISDFKEKFGLLIDIKRKDNIVYFRNSSIDYELDTLILNSSNNEIETSFLFLDGIAIEIESLETCIPVTNPMILTYPQKKQVFDNVRMRKQIEKYCGHSWEGDFYSIALLYGKKNSCRINL